MFTKQNLTEDTCYFYLLLKGARSFCARRH